MSEPRPIVIIANPVSGRKRWAGLVDEVIARLRRRGLPVEVYPTRECGHAEALAAAALDRAAGGAAPLVVAAGGDGTIQQVVNALMRPGAGGPTGAAPPVAATYASPGKGAAAPGLGIIPAGRCNDLARVLGVPTEPQALADMLAGGRDVPMDLGRVNGRFFCTVATLGFDAAVSRFVDHMRMPLCGTPAYLYGAARVLLHYRSPRLSLAGDFDAVDEEVFMASTANTATYGGSVPIVPDAVPTDGVLNLCLIARASRPKLVTLLLRVIQGRHRGAAGVRFLQTRGFTVETDRPQEIWADGERIGETPARFDILAGAIRVRLP